MRKIIILLVFTYILSVNPDKPLKSKNPLPYFRRQVEEIADDIPVERATEDTRGKLLSLLVKNVKELFNEIPEAEPKEYDIAIDSTSEALRATKHKFDTDNLITNDHTWINVKRTTAMPKFRDDDSVTIENAKDSVMPKYKEDDLVTIEHTNDVMLYENLSFTTLDQQLNDIFTTIKVSTSISTTPRKKTKETVKEMKSYEKSDAIIEKVTPLLTSISSYVLEPTVVTQDEPNKTCIYCNNILYENCIDPKNKLVPSVTCKRETDLCYSVHTPFGIVDRGCINVNHNLTTYVCSCNLCNYISISEMPYNFAKKQDWVDDVIELSRTTHFRKSVFKDMSCLRCEVNTTTKTGDMALSGNCIEGNIASLPIQNCKADEICGVKAVRSDGYIWRGCLSAPLYNYWWSLCDHDLCNHDSLVSIYDSIIS